MWHLLQYWHIPKMIELYLLLWYNFVGRPFVPKHNHSYTLAFSELLLTSCRHHLSSWRFIYVIEYLCPACDKRCKTSKCEVCGSRTKSKSAIYWCPTCNIPIWENECPECHSSGKYISTDIRPVFPQERLLVEILLNKPLQYLQSSVWFGGGRYIVDGKTVRLSSQVCSDADADAVRQALKQHEATNENNAFSEYADKWITKSARVLLSIQRKDNFYSIALSMRKWANPNAQAYSDIAHFGVYYDWKWRMYFQGCLLQQKLI